MILLYIRHQYMGDTFVLTLLLRCCQHMCTGHTAVISRTSCCSYYYMRTFSFFARIFPFLIYILVCNSVYLIDAISVVFIYSELRNDYVVFTFHTDYFRYILLLSSILVVYFRFFDSVL